jgi:hypothetical protein
MDIWLTSGYLESIKIKMLNERPLETQRTGWGDHEKQDIQNTVDDYWT